MATKQHDTSKTQTPLNSKGREAWQTGTTASKLKPHPTATSKLVTRGTKATSRTKRPQVNPQSTKNSNMQKTRRPLTSKRALRTKKPTNKPPKQAAGDYQTQIRRGGQQQIHKPRIQNLGRNMMVTYLIKRTN
ncbi:hypothetical protein U1Q18_024701 [Sarracenia purpurea var. burkii]